MKDAEWFAQHGSRCRVEWGRSGARAAAERGDILVVVDVLRFSSAVTSAVAHGVLVHPCSEEDDPHEAAARLDAVAAGQGVGGAPVSLSPLSFVGATPGARVVLRSPNGATCAALGGRVAYLFAGSLLNASAVGAAVTRLLDDRDRSVTVVACGERWEPARDDGALRFAAEDYLGAGAVLAAIRQSKSAEADLCETAFRASEQHLRQLLVDCGSGRELVAKGLAADVDFCAQLDAYDVAPSLRDGWFVPFDGSSPE